VNVLLVDTSVWVEFFRGRTYPELELALKEGRVVLSPIVLAELMSGPQNKSEERKLQDFLSELPLHQTPLEHWVAVGRLRHRLAKLGFKTSIPDTHIAQCTLDLEGYLLSQDQIFTKVANRIGLRLLSD